MGCMGIQCCSASAEGNDPANGVVRGNADGYAITRNYLDPEAAHPAAQLRKLLVALVALHTVKTATVNRHDRTLHINQIILAQMLSFLQSIIVPHPWCFYKDRTASSTCLASAA